MKTILLSIFGMLCVVGLVIWFGSCTGMYATSKGAKYNFALGNAHSYALYELKLEPISIVGIDCGNLNNFIYNDYVKCNIHYNENSKIVIHSIQCNMESNIWGGRCRPPSL